MDALNAFVGGWEWIVGLIAAVVGVWGVVTFCRSAALSYRAIRLYFIDTPHRGRISAAAELFGAIGWNLLRVFNERTLFKRVRMRLEFESLIERPLPDLRAAPEGDEAPYAQRIAQWRTARAALFQPNGETIEVDNPSAIHGRFDALDRLFDVLQILQRPRSEFRFATKIRINNGFVAPLHLIAGVLRQFDDDWARIIDTYGYDIERLAEPPPDDQALAALRELRALQKFIFDCWLQWGPSIPMCGAGCGNFGGSWLSLQYGYGDESNSVELVGAKSYLERLWSELRPPAGALAAPALVTGHIASSRFLPDAAVSKRVGKALATSWGSKPEDGRLLVLLSERASDRSAVKEEQVANAVSDVEVGSFERPAGISRYYSAYLWVIFVIQRDRLNDGEPRPVWTPTNPYDAYQKGSREPWLDFIPFFEHGNIAEPGSYLFLKRQLAEKAVRGIEKMVRNSESFQRTGDANAYPLRFALASSLDHSGCGATPMLFDGLDPAESIHALVHAEVLANPIARAVVQLDAYAALHPHASCMLPAAVRGYFAHVEEVAALTPSGES